MNRRHPLATVAALAVLATACSSGSVPTATPSDAIAVPATGVSSSLSPADDTVVLMQGVTRVDTAQSFEDPGFHQVISVSATIPQLGPLEGRTGSVIRVSLRDASRPEQTCSQDHPLSGCLTIDWSDAPGRPHVPDSGVFRNELTFITADGTTKLHLSDSGVLAETPDQFTPG